MWPVHWIKTSQFASQNYSINRSTLTFNSFNESNFGEYVCVSSNHLIKAEAHLILRPNRVSIINRFFKKNSPFNKNSNKHILSQNTYV